jgi:hypothetical protein
MKLFKCQHCGNPLYFENYRCLECGHPTGFLANKLTIITLIEQGKNTYQNVQNKEEKYHYCQNFAYNACNWLISSENDEVYCPACNLNQIIPDLSNHENLSKWQQIETAKHRLIYALFCLGLPIKPENDYPELAFRFRANTPTETVMTGHKNGLITLNIDEANEAKRVKHKLDLGERYRTLLGHFRHEVGHYYWDVLIQPSEAYLASFRKLFGDETQDYGEALDSYYEKGAPSDWTTKFISPYATSHPWEDWAETWAHYMHLMDTVQTAHAFGMDIDPSVDTIHHEMSADIWQDPYDMKDFSQIIKMWLPLTFAINSLNRSMGHGDFYPFIIQNPVIKKLSFIHQVCWEMGKKM